MKEKSVVTSFLRHGGKILLLQRSALVSTYRGYWAGVSGKMELEPLAQAVKEIHEETGLGEEDITLVRQGSPIYIEDRKIDIRWTVHPFLFDIGDPERIRMDWEHSDWQWVHPEELGHYQTVPGLADAWRRVAVDGG